jgi:seryl-tRNA synthetase
MLDIKLFRENPESIRENLKKRKDDERLKWVDIVIEKDNEYRKLLQETEKLRHRRNEITSKINELKKAGKNADNELKEAKEIPAKIKQIEESLGKVKAEMKPYLMGIPNIMHESVPYGKDDSENVEIRKKGKLPKHDFELVSHGELAESLGVADFRKAAIVSGAGFYYLMGDLARLNNALTSFALDFLYKKGFTMITPPLMLRREPYEGVVDLTDFENVMYKIEGDDLYMIATSEHPIAAFMMNEVIEKEKLPVLYCGFSPCFRKEIGAHGVDTKGLFRVHQFWKVEQFVYCLPEDSWKWHEQLIKNSEEMFTALGLPYRIVNICTGDLGTIAAKKYDLEVWMAKQKAYKEACSCSNCTDYQARRLNIKYSDKGEKYLLHTLNNTAIATSRAMVAILENNQNADGSVDIPEVLQPYMGGQKRIESRKTGKEEAKKEEGKGNVKEKQDKEKKAKSPKKSKK